MTEVVVDSSVILKWLSTKSEDHVEQANKLLQHVRDQRIELVSCELARYEVANAILKGKKFAGKQAEEALDLLYQLPINYISQTHDRAIKTYTLATEANITYYDASFLALAAERNINIVTANLKAAKKIKSVKVVPLADYA